MILHTCIKHRSIQYNRTPLRLYALIKCSSCHDALENSRQKILDIVSMLLRLPRNVIINRVQIRRARRPNVMGSTAVKIFSESFVGFTGCVCMYFSFEKNTTPPKKNRAHYAKFGGGTEPC